MGFLDKIRNVFSAITNTPEEKEFEKIVSDTYEEYAATHKYFWNAEINQTAVWTDNVKNWPDKKKASFILWLIPIAGRCMAGRRGWSSDDVDMQLNNMRQGFIQILLKNKLLMDDIDALNICYSFMQYRISDWSSLTHWPISLFLNQLERQRKDQVISLDLRTMLKNIKTAISDVKTGYHDKERIKMATKIDAMLFNHENGKITIKPARFLGEDGLADFANPAIANMAEQERLLWYKLLPVAQKATGSKPSKKYLDDTKLIIKELGTEKFKKTIHEWLQFLVDLKEQEKQHTHNYSNGRTYNYTSIDYLTSVNAE